MLSDGGVLREEVMEMETKPIVLKFGGSVLQTVCDLETAAQIIIEQKKLSSSLVVVVSAMGKVTDQLLALSRQISPHPPGREQDMLVSIGERMTMALLAMALKEKGQDALSFTGSQSGIFTSRRHADARIQAVKPDRILKALHCGQVAIVAGYQGMSDEKEITTLGRGGSDITAVALGDAVGASEVQFYKDVAGVYVEDPKSCVHSELLTKLSYQKAWQLSLNGPFVLSSRAIVFASKKKVILRVLSFDAKEREKFPGTVILHCKNE